MMEAPFIKNTDKKKWAAKGAMILPPILILLHHEEILNGYWIASISLTLGYFIGGALWGILAAYVHDWLYFRPDKISGKPTLSVKTRVTISVSLGWLLMLLGFLLIAGVLNLKANIFSAVFLT